MLDDTFYLDGVDALSFGIHLQEPVSFTGAEEIVRRVSIPGRSGELEFPTGAYKNRKGTAKCFALTPTPYVQNYVDAATRFLLGGPRYKRLETSADPDHYFIASVANGARIEDRAQLLAPFEIIFNCNPQRWLKSGDFAQDVKTGDALYNAWAPAKPVIEVSGDGPGTLFVGDYRVELKKLTGTVILDCEEMQGRGTGGGFASTDLSVNNWPILQPGKNVVYFTGGIKTVKIKPRWWCL